MDTTTTTSVTLAIQPPGTQGMEMTTIQAPTEQDMEMSQVPLHSDDEHSDAAGPIGEGNEGRPGQLIWEGSTWDACPWFCGCFAPVRFSRSLMHHAVATKKGHARRAMQQSLMHSTMLCTWYA